MLLLIVSLLTIGFSLATQNSDVGTYIIACHTTDFECFKRQYKALRDKVFLGNEKFVIDTLEPFMFKYGDNNTCIKLSGLEASELASISFNSVLKEYEIILTMPLKIEQLKEVDEKNATRFCSHIEHDFGNIELNKGKLNSFTGHVEVKVLYPFHLKTKRYTYLYLEEEDVDLILDIPDLSQYKDKSGEQGRLYLSSQWAYDVIKHVDVPKLVLLPYTARIRTAYQRIPLEKLLLLYPEEEYASVNFTF